MHASRRLTTRRRKHDPYFSDRVGIDLYITEHVGDYRAAVEALVRSNDVALEVGCAGGLTTKFLGRSACVAYGVDKSGSDNMHAEQQSYADSADNVHFEQIDAMDIGSLLQLSSRAAQEARLRCETSPRGFSVILIDISGSAKLSAVLDLLERYETCFKDSLRLVIIKSFRFACLCDRAQLFESVEDVD